MENNKCCKCNSDKNITEWYLKGRGFGSMFDLDVLTIPLCKECTPNDFEIWINEKPNHNDDIEIYEYEEELKNFIDSLPFESQEFILNTNNEGCDFKLPKDLFIKWIKDEIDVTELWNNL